MPYFDKQKADAACNFFECLLKHTADEYYGKPFILAPWEEEGIEHLFGWYNDDGTWLTKQAYFEVPKKSGKTEWCAGMVLMVLVLDQNPGCQVYGAAAGRRQALNVYRAAVKMVEQQPVLSKRLRVMRGTDRIVKRSDPDSFYAAIAADGDLSDGVNPKFVVADEVHRWRTRKQMENWDVLALGGITRTQSMTIGITTAGVQSESPLAWRLHEKAVKIQKGIVEDRTFFGRVYGAEPEDDWTDEATWKKANPSLLENGGFLPIAKLREVYESMLSDPEGQRSFRRYYLNIWDQKESRAIDMAQWEACPQTWKAAGLRERAPEDIIRPLAPELLRHFLERKCWAGVDLSFTTDLSAVTLVFPPDKDEYWDLLPFFWMPEATLHKRELQDGVPYRTWAAQGFLETCPGTAIDNKDVKERLKWASRMFNLQEICFDRYNTREMSVDLGEQGYPCKEIPQLYNLSEATKKMLVLVSTGKIRHGGHPVLKWNASCLSLKADDNDLVRPSKPQRDKHRTRIDGIAAAITALSQAVVAVDKTSVYETRGLRTL